MFSLIHLQFWIDKCLVCHILLFDYLSEDLLKIIAIIVDGWYLGEKAL